MFSQSVFRMLRRKQSKFINPEFKEKLRSIIQCPPGNIQCGSIKHQCAVKNRVLINSDWIRTNVLDRTQFILWYESRIQSKHTKCITQMDGFLLAYTKKIYGENILYIDLVCSAHNKGKLLLVQAESLAVSIGANSCVVRASTSELIPYYTSLGYTTVSNACHIKQQISERNRYQHVNKNANIKGIWMSKCLLDVKTKKLPLNTPGVCAGTSINTWATKGAIVGDIIGIKWLGYNTRFVCRVEGNGNVVREPRGTELYTFNPNTDDYIIINTHRRQRSLKQEAVKPGDVLLFKWAYFKAWYIVLVQKYNGKMVVIEPSSVATYYAFNPKKDTYKIYNDPIIAAKQ